MKKNKELAKYLDLANHRSTATKKDVEAVCQKVLDYGFNAAFVNPCWVRLAKTYLKQNHKPPMITPKVGTVISFPLGQDTTEAKLFSVRELVGKGVDELDVSTNIGWLKEGKEKLYLKEMKRIVQLAKKLKPNVIIKFIIEAGKLTETEIKKASLLVLKSGADFIKSNSGMITDVKLKEIEIIKKAVGDKIKIKAAGGIATTKQAQDFIKAGVSQIGTSKAVEIVAGK